MTLAAYSEIMRSLFLVALLAGLVAPAHAASGDIPLIGVGIGLQYAPETPRPVAPTHPLYQRIAINDIDGLPPTVGSSALNFISAAKRSSINAALRENFQRMNMLAPDAASARTRLTVRWGGQRTPFHIGRSNSATVTMHYHLTRIDNGQTIFDREIATSVSGGGVDAGMRDDGIVRAAIATNFASAANCLDRAAYGSVLPTCALTPKFSVSVVRTR